MYRSGVHPAVQVCVRREGEIVLDRAIGHARGNGPDDSKETPKVAATPDTPMTVYSAAKGVTAFVAHKMVEKGLFALDDPVAAYIPGYDKNKKGSITIGHVLSHRAGVPNLPREALSLDYIDDREYLAKILCDAKPMAEPGKLLAYHAVSGGFIIGELIYQVTGKSIRDVLAEEILDPLGFRWTNYGVAPEDTDRGRAELPDRADDASAPVDALAAGAGRTARRAGRDHERRPLRDRRRARREPRHDGPRAFALLRGHALRRRARRRPSDGDGHDPQGARGAVAPRDRFLAGLPDPLLLRAHARRSVPQPLRARHAARVRASRLHQHPWLGRPRARDLGRGAHQRQADPLPRASALPDALAAHHLGVAEGARRPRC